MIRFSLTPGAHRVERCRRDRVRCIGELVDAHSVSGWCARSKRGIGRRRRAIVALHALAYNTPSDMTHTIAVIAGDGIGKEVIPAGMAAIQTAIRGTMAEVAFTELPWGCEHYLAHGRMMAEDGFERLAAFDAIYLGAIGAPGVPDGISAALILAIRQRFDQYVNLRPMRLLNGIASPLANRSTADIDMICVRENSEGEYSGVGGRVHRGTPQEVAQQVGVFTRRGIERILRYGFELAAKRPRRLLASATKSNALTHAMVLWDEVAEAVRTDYPAVEYRKYHVDALAARMVTHPQTLDVMVTSNLFGDILTDIGSAISGSLGIAPGANINPARTYPSMFEPIHGSAPDIAGKGIANPIGAIWAGALMLEHLGHRDVHDRIISAIERVVASATIRTPDLGGTATTKQMTDAIVREM
jgi:tartrate dehydrogenase/decarboxylase/D-malate dehydrogenase